MSSSVTPDCDLQQVEISTPSLQSLKVSAVSMSSSVNAAVAESQDPNVEGADTMSQTLIYEVNKNFPYYKIIMKRIPTQYL